MNSNRLTIAFDTLVLSPRFANTGSYIYARNLLLGFKRHLNNSPDISICGFAVSHESPEASWLRALNVGITYSSVFKIRPLWRLAGLNLAASKSRADLLFSPTAHCVPLHIPVVTTIHDITPMRLPAHMVHRSKTSNFITRISAKRSAGILTDSNHSKRDLMEVFDLPEERIRVAYLGYDKAIYNTDPPDDGCRAELFSRLRIGRPYILHHGMVQSRKNLRRLVQAYGLLIKGNKALDLQLVFAGPLGFQHEEVLSAAQDVDPSGERILFTGPLPDNEMSIVVKSATLAVIPSLYEGFCLPMVEAMACGVPTIAANSSCLPEISGGGLRYFDPISVDSIYVGMTQAIESADIRKEIVRNALSRTAELSWDRCAGETLDFLVETRSETAQAIR